MFFFLPFFVSTLSNCVCNSSYTFYLSAARVCVKGTDLFKFYIY